MVGAAGAWMKKSKKNQGVGRLCGPASAPAKVAPSIRAGTVPTGCSIDGALLLSGLRLSAVRDYTGTLPQCKAIARPPLAGGLVGCQRHRQIINISDTLNHVAARVPAVDAVSEIRLGGCHKGESARQAGRTRLHTDFWYLILHPPVDYFASTPRGPSSVLPLNVGGLNDACALPQCDGLARPLLAGSFVGRHRQL
jgi:hypothetical protein